ncbi:hypothetical protein IG193_00740 [Infirmifilum lucidum]|uniref:Uncharacterized protein n=1 Tax=Infirmifilum lucidum TaxID=2776706 RepID=A0A7L9FGS0_9CREN|nr:hypothetical protein [Infirmifilum lucidum]QOJ79028.1 hypothetical protein IG193_00740 [Infirmifilum lucidum]
MTRAEKALLVATSLAIAFLATLSGPLAESLPVKKAILSLGQAKATFEDFEARAIMAYHVAAVVVMSALAYLALRYVDMDQSYKPGVSELVTAGWSLAIPSGIVFAYFWRSPLVHTVWIVGLALVFAGAVALLYAMSPLKTSWRDNTLEKAAFFTTGLCLVLSITLGGVYASYFGFDRGARPVLLEHHSTLEYRDLGPVATPLQLVATGHAHGAVALWGAALMLIGFKWVGASGRLYRWALAFTTIGSVITLAGILAVVPLRPIAHQVIYFGVAPLHASLFILWLYLLKQVAGGGWRDSVKFGLFLSPVLTVALVTSTGPLVAAQLRDVVRVVWPLRDEISYNVAHWHMLALIFAYTTFLLYADALRGLPRRLIWLFVAGAAVALVGAFVYELSPMLAGARKGIPPELAAAVADKSRAIKEAALAPIEVGLTMLFIGFTAGLAGLLRAKEQ